MEIVRGILINVGVPLGGVLVFVSLCLWMWMARIKRPPLTSFFIIFATYGGWLMIVVTLRFWYWSGMALLGLMYLVLVAPFVMVVLAALTYSRRNLSRFHLVSFVASGLYPFLIGALLLARTVYGLVTH